MHMPQTFTTLESFARIKGWELWLFSPKLNQPSEFMYQNVHQEYYDDGLETKFQHRLSQSWPCPSTSMALNHQVPAAPKRTAVSPTLHPLPRLCICMGSSDQVDFSKPAPTMWNSVGFVKSGCALRPIWCVPGECQRWDNINATTEER